VVYLGLGLALLIYGVVVLHRDHSQAGRLSGLSYVAGWASLSLWYAPNSAIVDALVHVPGIGRLLNDICATGSVILQFAFISTLAGSWPKWRTYALGVYGVLLTLIVLLWCIVRVTITHNISQLLYHGYYVHPLALFIWNLLVGVTISYTCSLSFIGYMHALPVQRTRFTRVTTRVVSAVYALAAVYGLLIVMQLMADWGGFGHLSILRYTGAIVLICVVTTLVSTGAVIFGQASWRYLRQWFSLSYKEAVLSQLLQDTINANVLVSDQRVYLERPAARRLVRALKRHLRTQHVSGYQCKVGCQAVRLVILGDSTLRLDSTDEGRDDALETEKAADQDLLIDLSRRIEEDLFSAADSYRVARLVILALRGEDVLPQDLVPDLDYRFEPPGWRRTLARQIVAVIHAYQQDERRQRTDLRRGRTGTHEQRFSL